MPKSAFSIVPEKVIPIRADIIVGLAG